MSEKTGKTLFLPVDGNVRQCTLCGKDFEKDVLLVKDGDLCPECRKEYGNLAFIYCMSCKKVVSRVMPGLTESGLLVKPGDLLHVKECPLCHPGLVEIIPEEMKKK